MRLPLEPLVDCNASKARRVHSNNLERTIVNPVARIPISQTNFQFSLEIIESNIRKYPDSHFEFNVYGMSRESYLDNSPRNRLGIPLIIWRRSKVLLIKNIWSDSLQTGRIESSYAKCVFRGSSHLVSLEYQQLISSWTILASIFYVNGTNYASLSSLFIDHLNCIFTILPFFIAYHILRQRQNFNWTFSYIIAC